MPALSRARTAWLLPGLALVLLVVSVVAEARLPSSLATELVPDPTWIFAFTGLVHAVVAVAVRRHSPGTRLGGLLTFLAVYWLLGAVAHLLARQPEAASALADGAQGWDVVLLWAVKLTSAPLSAGANVVVALFPDGRFVPGLWGRVGRLAMAILAGVTVALLFLRTPLAVTLDPALTSAHPAIDATVLPGAAWLPSAGALIALSYVGASLTALTVVMRFRRARGVERDQLRWLMWGVLFVVLVVLGFRLVLDPGQLNTVGILLAVNVLVVSVGIALINPSLVSIEDLLARTLVYGGLSLAIVVIDLGVLAGLTAVLGERLDDEQVVLVVLLLSAVLYNPLRSWLWALVRRLVLGERGDRYDVVAGLASSLEAADESSEQLAAVARAVGQAFGVGFVRVEVDRGTGGPPAVATYGLVPSETRDLPISYRGEQVGRLVLPARGFRTRLSARDQRLLGDLVRQAATAARTGRLAEQLQHNRQLLVVAREEERRRIRDDLHEDLGPTLGGLVHQVESARLLVRDQPEVAKQTIARTSQQLRAVVADVRRVVHDLRPPALDDRGLVGALRQQAELGTTETLQVTVTGERLEGLPAAVEVAAFRIAGQALADVRADRTAHHCEIALRRAGRVLELDLRTDAALDPASLRDKAAEIGGRVEAGPGVVRVRLPLREEGR